MNSFDEQAIPDLKSEAIDFRAASELSAPYRQMTVQAWNALRILTMARSATTADPQGAPSPSGTNHWRTASFRQGPVRPVPGCLDPGGSLCRNKSNASVSRYVTLPRACGSKVEMSPLSKVEMSPSTQFEVPAIPSCGIILHRVQPSRLPSGAQDAALTAPVRDAQGYSQMREWRALFWLFRARGDISTLPARGTFLLCRDSPGIALTPFRQV